MQSYTLELFPSYGPVHIFLFCNVRNSMDLRKRLLSHDQELAYAFIDARVVLDTFQLLIATNGALHNDRNSALRTHNVHSEIVYNLSPTPNISESLRRFGISNNTKDIVVIKVGGEFNEIKSHLNSLIQGTESSLEEFQKSVDIESVRKYYKIDSKIKDHGEMLNTIVGSIAIKSVN
ncbi:3839_t:CDS:2 [Acaulospora morrowiae]|uniref:EKC/KEOPS complex subunit CGI121 n=1 Tax=Acaulospora morrowiae TaxID=94023 RepID=A0A9N9B153_9GLOM|nr:3839_t:CDS:2 [Acaulospora morrowiae]